MKGPHYLDGMVALVPLLDRQLGCVHCLPLERGHFPHDIQVSGFHGTIHATMRQSQVNQSIYSYGPTRGKVLTAFLFSFTILGRAQNGDSLQVLPREEPFTIQTATAKVLRDYPHARAAVPVLAKNVIPHRELVYSSIGKRELHLDVYEPADSAGRSFPAILFIHGGGWRSGDRSMEVPMALRLAVIGFVTATVEYRLSREALYPAAVQDLKAAVRWLRARALDYHIDTTRIGVCGGSSGGHLAALLGVTNGTRQYEEQERNPGHSSEVQAVVDIDGPVDLTRPEESGKDQDPLKPSAGKHWIGFGFEERPDLWREASPLTYRNKMTPPIAFINSSIARFHVGRDEMIDKLKSMNIHTEVHSIPNSPHPFWLFHPWFEQTATYVEAFFIKILKKQ